MTEKKDPIKEQTREFEQDLSETMRRMLEDLKRVFDTIPGRRPNG